MCCESPSLPQFDSPPSLHDQEKILSTVTPENVQLSFVYQPGIGLYDKKKLPSENQSSSRSVNNDENNPKRKLTEALTNEKKTRQTGTNMNFLSTSTSKLNRNRRPCATFIHLSALMMQRNIIKNTDSSMVDQQSERFSSIDQTPSQGLLLCPKNEPKKKKRKILSDPEFFENDQIIVDQILFDEMETVQQQWQQFLMLTMERELHFHSSETKKRNKLKKFTRTKEFFLAYDSLFDFEGMRHWCPTQI